MARWDSFVSHSKRLSSHVRLTGHQALVLGTFLTVDDGLFTYACPSLQRYEFPIPGHFTPRDAWVLDFGFMAISAETMLAGSLHEPMKNHSPHMPNPVLLRLTFRWHDDYVTIAQGCARLSEQGWNQDSRDKTALPAD